MSSFLRKVSSIAIIASTMWVIQAVSVDAQVTTITFDANSASDGSTPSAVTGMYSWTAPAGVSSINIKLWGAGGNGGGKIGNVGAVSGGGGAGGGLVTATVPVTAGQTYTLHVGAARTQVANPGFSYCTTSGQPTNFEIESWFGNQLVCPYINAGLYLESAGGLIGGVVNGGGGAHTLYPAIPGGNVNYYANGASGVSAYIGGSGGTGVHMGPGPEFDCYGGGGGGAAGGGSGAAGGGAATAGANGTGAGLGGGNGGIGANVLADPTIGFVPGGGGGGSCNINNFYSKSLGGAGRVVISYNTPVSGGNFIDIGLRINQGTSGSPDKQHIAIEDPAGSHTSKLKIAKNGTVYYVALVAVGDANATKAKVKLADGTVMALRACTAVPSNGCAFVP